MPAEPSDHVIVCGYGLVGEKVVDILTQHGIDVVVIDVNKAKVDALTERGVRAVLGDATSSRVLRSAGVERARAIAVAMDDDAKNLFTVITARSLNEKIVIATRANDELLKDKLKEAGAKFVATPNKSASDELFRELTKGA
ncbi:MAG: NAD-binding protein [Candidatus Micrarchaeota archaeon]|nr:NAD-binding protein [Candidatus Micrarchaeota archaeon]